MRGCCFLVNSGLGRHGQGTVDVQDAPEKRVVRGQAGIQGQGAFRAVGADLCLQFHALGVLRAVKAEGGSGAEEEMVHRETVGIGRQQRLDEPVCGVQLADGLPAHPDVLVLQIGVLVAAEGAVDISVVGGGIKGELADQALAALADGVIDDIADGGVADALPDSGVALEILVSDRSQLAARSAAMLGAMAAGIPPEETAARMAGSGLEPVRPDEAHREAYEAIYRRWKRYHDCLAHVEK